MNVFKRHASANEKQAKEALVEVASQVIGKYIITQEVLSTTLSGGHGASHGESCLLCKVDKLTKLMAKLELQVGQISKTYDLMFDEELDVKAITAAAVKEFYPLMCSTPSSKSSSIEDILSKVFPGASSKEDVHFPEGTPQEVKDITSTIRESLSKFGKEFDFQVLDMNSPDGIYGVKPQDFKSFGDFWKAVIRARKELRKSSETGESEGKEAVLHPATEKESIKDSSKPSVDKGKGKNTSSSNGTESKDPKLN